MYSYTHPLMIICRNSNCPIGNLIDHSKVFYQLAASKKIDHILLHTRLDYGSVQICSLLLQVAGDPSPESSWDAANVQWPAR